MERSPHWRDTPWPWEGAAGTTAAGIRAVFSIWALGLQTHPRNGRAGQSIAAPWRSLHCLLSYELAFVDRIQRRWSPAHRQTRDQCGCRAVAAHHSSVL